AAPGCAFSHASTVAASRSGSMSTTTPVSMLTSTVPYTCPLRRAKSSMPSISGAMAASHSGRAAISRRIVDECTAMPSHAASRAALRQRHTRRGDHHRVPGVLYPVHLQSRQLRKQQDEQLLALLRDIQDADGGRRRRNGRHDTLDRHRGSGKGRYLGGFLRPTG